MLHNWRAERRSSWLCLGLQWSIHRGNLSPQISVRVRGGKSCKSPPPHFLTHNDAISGFTSQSSFTGLYIIYFNDTNFNIIFGLLFNQPCLPLKLGLAWSANRKPLGFVENVFEGWMHFRSKVVSSRCSRRWLKFKSDGKCHKLTPIYSFENTRVNHSSDALY